MAFTLNLANEKIFSQVANGMGFGIWRYGNPNSAVGDTLATILGGNYFSAAGYLLGVGDLILVRDSAGVEAMLQVTANTNLPVLVTGNPAPTPTGTVTVATYFGASATISAGLLGSGTGKGPEILLSTTSATVATGTGTSEQILGTYTLPANSLDIAGRKLRIRAAFACAANANNKTAKLYFGASVITTPTAATNAKNIVLELIVTKSGASTQIVYGTGLVDVTPVTPFVNTAGADTDTAGIVIKATATDGTSSAADMTLVDFSVEYLN